jgi:hypothetical protein
VLQQAAVRDVFLGTSTASVAESKEGGGEKKHSARKESPDVHHSDSDQEPTSGDAGDAAKGTSASSSSGHHASHGPKFKQKCKVCDIADNHDMLSNWSKWHLEKSERILCYGRDEYNKYVHFEHSKNI